MSKRKPSAFQGGEDTATIVLSSNPEQLQEHLQNRNAQRPEVIRQATIVDGSKLNVQFTVEIPNGIDTTTKKCSAPVHDDLRRAFKRLDEHLGRLCEQPLTMHNPAHRDNKEAPPLICPVSCVGFKLSSSGEREAITLYGTRLLSNAKNIDIQSPSQQFQGDIFPYEHSDELSEIIQECVGEVELYLFENKHQPDNQLSLFNDEEEESEEETE